MYNQNMSPPTTRQGRRLNIHNSLKFQILVGVFFGITALALTTEAAIYESDVAALTGCKLRNKHAEYMGQNYIAYEDYNSYSEWTINAPVMGLYDISVRYSTLSSNPTDLYLDGSPYPVDTFDFSEIGDWNTWNIETLRLELSQGSHQLKLLRQAPHQSSAEAANKGNKDEDKKEKDNTRLLRGAKRMEGETKDDKKGKKNIDKDNKKNAKEGEPEDDKKGKKNIDKDNKKNAKEGKTEDDKTGNKNIDKDNNKNAIENEASTALHLDFLEVVLKPALGDTPSQHMNIFRDGDSLSSAIHDARAPIEQEEGDYGGSIDDATGPIFYQAEDGVIHKGEMDNSSTGYTGNGYFDYHGYSGYIEWIIDAPEAGDYEISLRYAAHNLRPLDVYLDGNTERSGEFSCQPTGGWNVWQTEVMILFFTPGSHTIRLEATHSTGPNVDFFSVVLAGN
jgi:hypothetical protein